MSSRHRATQDAKGNSGPSSPGRARGAPAPQDKATLRTKGAAVLRPYEESGSQWRWTSRAQISC
jgi:hypothetical protein